MKLLTTCRDWQVLREVLNKEKLFLIDSIMLAYVENKIDFIEPDELIINDENYIETGFELLIMKWCEGMEDTEDLIDMVGGKRYGKICDWTRF